MEKIEITKDDPLQPGDLIEMHFSTFGSTWLKATQLAIIESRLEKDPRYYIERWRFDDHNLILQIRIIEPAIGQVPVYQAGTTPALIAVAVIAAAGGLFMWLSLGKIYKIMQTSAGKVLTITTALIAAGIVYILLRKK